MTPSDQTPGALAGPAEYDVVICGGGVAGLALARHLKKYQPERSVLLLDRLVRPLPPTTLKVGESTTEPGAYYLSQLLDLSGYFESSHVRKAGFRFFFGQADRKFADRPEFGIARPPAIPSFNIERGRLEEDLRQFNADSGIPMLEGCTVNEIALADGDQLHTVTYRERNGKQARQIRARWVIDAMGRRHYLQKKLGLTREQLRRGSAVWFRVPARVDVGDLVPEVSRPWHERVPDGLRLASTNHLMGKGYWVWLIPLRSGATSIGIVALEEMHPFNSFNTLPRARTWLQQYEPQLARHIRDLEPLDFKCMRRYSYSSKQVFSEQRWACIGEAATFADPLYAPGFDFIALGNLISAELIRLDFEGQLRPETARKYNQFLLALNDTMTQNIQLSYALFDQETVMSAKVLWDTTAGWALFAPLIFNPAFFTNDEVNAQLREVKGAYYILSKRMQQLFIDWAARSSKRMTFQFIDFLSLPFLLEIRDRNLCPNKSNAELVEDQRRNMEVFETLALALFLLAVEDVMPDRYEQLSRAGWLNAWRIGLDPERWERDGLFRPHTAPRDLKSMVDQIRGLYHTRESLVA